MDLNRLHRFCIPGIYARVRPNSIAGHVTMNLISNFPGKLVRWFWRCNWMYDLPSRAVANFQYPGPGSATITNRSQPSDTKRKRKRTKTNTCETSTIQQYQVQYSKRAMATYMTETDICLTCLKIQYWDILSVSQNRKTLPDRRLRVVVFLCTERSSYRTLISMSTVC